MTQVRLFKSCRQGNFEVSLVFLDSWHTVTCRGHFMSGIGQGQGFGYDPGQGIDVSLLVSPRDEALDQLNMVRLAVVN